MPAPWLWLVAGINGAGKTTLAESPAFRALLSQLPILNPDVLADQLLERAPGLDRGQANLRAADEIEDQVRKLIADGRSFAVETVLSSDKYKSPVEEALAAGYRIGMIYVALSSPEIAISRVRMRVAAGGHDVPTDKIRQRWNRSLDNLVWFARHVSRLLVFCNDDPFGNPVLVATGTGGRLRILRRDLVPEVTERLQNMTGAGRI